MSIANAVLAAAFVYVAPHCSGHWEQVRKDGPWTISFNVADPTAPSLAELRDEHGHLLAVIRSPSTTYWRCVPYSTGPVS